MLEVVGVYKFGESDIAKNPKKAGWRRVMVKDEAGQREAICFSTDADRLTPGPMPEGWKLESGGVWDDGRPKSPKLVPPGGGAPGVGGKKPFETSWRNTEAGFRYEQERMDRRTAAMKATDVAVARWKEAGMTTEARIVSPFDEGLADKIYNWLRNGQ